MCFLLGHWSRCLPLQINRMMGCLNVLRISNKPSEEKIFFCLFCAIILIRKSFGLNSLCRFLSIPLKSVKLRQPLIECTKFIVCLLIESPFYRYIAAFSLQEMKKPLKQGTVDIIIIDRQKRRWVRATAQKIYPICMLQPFGREPSRNRLLRK